MSLQLGRLVRDNRLVDKVCPRGLAQGLRPEDKETSRHIKKKSGPFSFLSRGKSWILHRNWLLSLRRFQRDILQAQWQYTYALSGRGLLYKSTSHVVSWPMKFELVGRITQIGAIATGSEIRVRRYLRKAYGPGRWRKLKGIATVRLPNGAL